MATRVVVDRTDRTTDRSALFEIESGYDGAGVKYRVTVRSNNEEARFEDPCKKMMFGSSEVLLSYMKIVSFLCPML